MWGPLGLGVCRDCYIVRACKDGGLITDTHTHTDLYFTRVVPSKQFDLLPEDFDFTLVAAVVGGLLGATFILSKLSGRKLLKLIWK